MRILMLLLATAAIAAAQTDETNSAAATERMMVRVTGDRVSLRTAPSLEGYLLDSAMSGDELVYCGRTNGWVEVQAPDTLDVWISGEYIEDGVVKPKKLNVRAGPSLNYDNIAVLSKGDQVEVRSEFNNWLKIAPPPGCHIWISEDYVEYVEPPAPEPVVEALPEPEMVEEPDSANQPQMVAELEPPKEELQPLVLVLDKSRKQGEYVEIPGVLRRANPGLYQLVLIEDGWEEPICLVRGQESQMETYLNRSMLIKGKRFWAKDIDLPVIQPERIHLDPIIND